MKKSHNIITSMEFYAVSNDGHKTRLPSRTLASAKKTATMRGCAKLIALEVIHREIKNRIKKVGKVQFIYVKGKSWQCLDNQTANGHSLRVLIDYCNNFFTKG